MPAKKQLLLKSIHELLALNVSDKEITMNLKEVGIDRAQAKRLIKEAKEPKSVKKEPDFFEKFENKKPSKTSLSERRSRREERRAKLIEQKREAATEALAEATVSPEENSSGPDDIVEELQFESQPAPEPEPRDISGIVAGVKRSAGAREEAAQEEEKSFIETPPIKVDGKVPGNMPVSSDEDVSKLWEKGILGTVNQNLSEMKRLRDEIKSIIDLKVQQSTKQEMIKIKVLHDSQRALLVSKVDEEIEAKAKSFANMIELKLREMREINTKVDAQMERLSEEKERIKEQEDSFYLRLKDIDRVKEDLVASMNSELIKAKTQNKQMVTDMNGTLKEMDARINKTLELENQVVQGLVKESEQKIKEMIEAKSIAFATETKQQLAEIKKLKESYEVEHKQKLTELEQKMKTSILSLDNQVKGRMARLDQLQKAITVEFKPEKFTTLMNELNEFKTQFVDAIQVNAKRFNEGIKSLNNQSKMIEKRYNLRVEKIDKKIAELDAFEKNFAKEIGVSLSKLTKKPPVEHIEEKKKK